MGPIAIISGWVYQDLVEMAQSSKYLMPSIFCLEI